MPFGGNHISFTDACQSHVRYNHDRLSRIKRQSWRSGSDDPMAFNTAMNWGSIGFIVMAVAVRAVSTIGGMHADPTHGHPGGRGPSSPRAKTVAKNIIGGFGVS
ncbi:hypothetical protein O9992_09030 [Vibrio lentus]|nr:hypothetical protein [Vibrio lentus]